MFVSTPDLIWYKGDAATLSGTTLINSATSGGSYNASIWTGNGTVTQGTFGGKTAISVASAGNTYFVVTTPTFNFPISNGRGYTLSFWFYYATSGSSVPRIMSIGNTTNASNQTDAGYDAPSIYGTNPPYAIQEQGGSTPYFSAANFLGTGNWNHCVLIHTCTVASLATQNYVINGSGTCSLYINGVLQSVGTSLQGYPGAGSTWSMGLCTRGATIYYRDIRIYTSILTPSQVAWIYGNT